MVSVGFRGGMEMMEYQHEQTSEDAIMELSSALSDLHIRGMSGDEIATLLTRAIELKVKEMNK